MSAIAYPVGENLYLNITNRCTNQCDFCIRYKSRVFNQKYPLWLEKEPSADEVLAAIGDPAKYKQVVFCGYGEPLIRLELVKEIAAKLKNKTRTRIDTNGQANLFWGRNILPELEGLIDAISISLNAETQEVYDRICHPAFNGRAFPAIIEFVREAKKHIPKVEISLVDLPIINLDRAREIAKELKVSFRVRPYYEEIYVR